MACFKAFLGATEQENPRLSGKCKRRARCSGKSKRHTVKAQLTVNTQGLIGDLQGQSC